jgi:DNA-binding NarL/FixJ family response regulator
MKKLKIVLADDQVLFVESLKNVLEIMAKDFDIVGVAADGEEAIRCVDEQKPDVVLMDVRMPNVDGVEATRVIHARYPWIHIIMLTTFDDDEYVDRALHYGAAGYLLKDIRPIDVIGAVKAVSEGSVLIAPRIASRLVVDPTRQQTQGGKSGDEKRPPWLELLSKREIEVLKHLAQGYSNKEIANKVCVAEQTVRNYVSEIYAKAGVNNRYKLIESIREYYRRDSSFWEGSETDR